MKRRLALPIIFIAAIAAAAGSTNVLAAPSPGATVHLKIASDGMSATYARTLAPYLAAALPDHPAVVVDAATGSDRALLNAFTAKAKADGSTVMIGRASVFNPLSRDVADALAETAKIKPIGGNADPGSAMIVAVDAFDRLYDNTQRPVTVGGDKPPDAGTETALWGIAYLNWNVHWRLDQPNTAALLKALDSGTIDMASLKDGPTVQNLTSGDRFQVLAQSGVAGKDGVEPRPEFLGPLFGDLIANEIVDDPHQQAYAYWHAYNQLDLIAALPAATPAATLEVFRTAFATASENAEFRAKLTLAGVTPLQQTADNVGGLLKTLQETPVNALAAFHDMAAKQGLDAGG